MGIWGDSRVANIKNAARLAVLRERNSSLQELFQKARRKLAAKGTGEGYQALFEKLLMQALIKVMEPKVVVNVREADLALAKKVIPGVVAEYEEKTRTKIEIKLDEKRFLPASPLEVEDGAPSCCGGVLVSARKGKIMCSNTLDTRLEIAYENLLPQVRSMLFDESE